MLPKARKYLIAETLSSFVVNAILNFLPAYFIFRNHPVVPVNGHGGMFQDSIGAAFIVTFLSYLVPALIGRSRRRAGTLPISGLEGKTHSNVYLRALGLAVLFTIVLTGLNAVLMPRIFGLSVSLHTELAFKTIYGAVVGALASFLAILRALHEETPVSGKR